MRTDVRRLDAKEGQDNEPILEDWRTEGRTRDVTTQM